MRLEDLVRRAAQHDGDHPAVALGDESLTYAALWARSDALARRLRTLGLSAGDRVVVWARKSPDVVALFQACLRLGVVYVPVAVSNPADRLLRIAGLCSPGVVVVDDEDQAQAVAADLPLPAVVLTLAELSHGAGTGPEARDDAAVAVRRDPHELAYILFTSGSTGVPKGVCVSHRNALAFVEWAVRATELSATDRVANHAAFTFDLSVFDLYATFAAGAVVDIVPEQDAFVPGRLVQFLVERQVTVWYSVPSVMSLLVTRTDLESVAERVAVRRMVLAGEPISVPHLRRAMAALPRTRFSNWYGPTETNVCTGYDIPSPVPETMRTVPIGRAASGARLEIRSADGEPGTLWVEGPSVMHGYWGAEPSGGVHDTGDVVVIGAGGELEFSHRADTMLKVRGHRADATEIEACLESHPAVASAAVVVEGEGITARIVAFVVPAVPDAPPGLLTLKAHLGDRLPAYMNVDRVVVVAMLPLSPNGKKDHRALRDSLTPAPAQAGVP